MKTLYVALFAAAAATGAAQAGNITAPAPTPVVVAPTPAPAPVYADWTGFYGGVQLGYGFADTSIGLSGDGLVGGLRAGYDYDFGGYVLGLGIDYDFAGINLTGGAGSIDGVGRLKARAGFDAGPALIYATGGMALANVTVGGTGVSDVGYLLGGGIEFRLTDAWALGAEALWHDFGPLDNQGFNATATTIGANVTYRF